MCNAVVFSIPSATNSLAPFLGSPHNFPPPHIFLSVQPLFQPKLIDWKWLLGAIG